MASGRALAGVVNDVVPVQNRDGAQVLLSVRDRTLRSGYYSL